MTFQIGGHRASEYKDLMKKYSGLPLDLIGGEVKPSSGAYIVDPFASKALQKLILDIIGSSNVVTITAFGGHPEPVGVRRGWLDSFHGLPHHLPKRSVYIEDFKEVEKQSPILAKGLMGHVLQEYFLASRPAGITPGKAYGLYHDDKGTPVPAMVMEARIVGELSGRAIWTGAHRPHEQSYYFGATEVHIRSLGPDLKFQLTFDAHNRLIKVHEPPGLPR